MKNSPFFLALAALFMLAMLVQPGSAVSIQKFGINSNSYVANDTITVSGDILAGNASGEVNITIWPRGSEFSDQSNQSGNKTVNAINSSFSTTIQAPGTSGEYTIIAEDVESGARSPFLYFNVLGINDPNAIKVLLTQGDILTVQLSTDHNINGPLNVSKTGGNITYDDKTYYFLVSDSNIVYVDDDPDMNLSSDSSGVSVVGNLVQGSKVKLNSTTYTLIHIHNSTELVLASPVKPTFSGGGYANVTLLALNSSNYPISNTNIALELVTDNGTSISNSTLTTSTNGTVTTIISVPGNSGVYHLIAGNIGHMSFVVNTVSMFGDILSEEYKPKHTFARGENLIAAVYLKNRTSGTPISTGTVIANITRSTNASTTESLTLTYNSNISAYTYTYTVPENAAVDTYNVEYKAVIGSQTQKAFTSYNVKNFDLFLRAVSEKNDESDGFAPGEEGFLILAGTNLSSNEKLNIEATIGLDVSNFRVNITDTTGNDVTPAWSVMNLATFFSYRSVPFDIQEEIKQRLGENLTIINFTAPSTTGVYDVLIQVNLTDWTNARTTISIQDLFVHGEPVNKNGWFSPKVAPGAYARLMIMAFDPSNGEQLSAGQINDAGLVEVWSQSANDVVTQYMLNVTLEEIEVPFMGTIKVLKFKANDSYLGFHHVKFWVNATVDGTPKQVIGDGWFDEKLYTIRAKPALDSNTGVFRVFGSSDTIQLEVEVEDVSGNNVSSATIEIESVKYGMTGETVPFGVDTSSSFTTGSNGTATVEFTPSSSLKSGFYNVRLKMTTQDGTTDYGNGWFEVSNYIFFVHSTSWDVGTDQPINFSFKALESNFGHKNVSVTLTKVISMGDWEMMSPPSVYNDTNVDIGYINGTGYYEYPGLNKGGNYEFVFEATDGNSTEVGRAFVHATSFIAWVDTDGKREFSITGFMNFTVEASDDMWWGGTPHNITNVTVEKVMQEGMWMTTYRNKTAMAALTTTSNGVSENQINVSINTSGWGQGSYSMTLKVTDNQSDSIYIHHWFQLKLASVTVPELTMVTINGGQYYTNVTSINATTDITSKKNYFANSSLGNISAGKVSGPVIEGNPITMIVSSGNDQIIDLYNHSQVPYFAMVAVDTINKTVYIEFENQSDPGNQYYNLSDSTTTQVFNASAGDNFTDYTGRIWNITEITDDGTVNLEGINTLRNGLIVDSSVFSMSISGKFLLGTIWDEEWRDVDLDGDGQYYGDERYQVLMADPNISGKYDTVYVSNVSNFSNGSYKDASAGVAVEFGGNPVYLLSNKYLSGAYTLDFTTYRKGWPGMHLGTFANGSILKIPFLVLAPDGTPVSGSNVSIDFLLDQSRESTPLAGVDGITDANGLVIISINTSEVLIPTGSWMIHYNASVTGGYAVADEEMFWEMTRFELRNFMVSGALGVPGSIDMIQLKDTNTEDLVPGDNMLISYGDEIEFKRGIGLWPSGNNEYQLEYPFDKWYYNSSTGGFNYSIDGGSTMYPGNGTLINSSSARNVITYNVTLVKSAGENKTLNPGSNQFYDNMWIFNVTDISPGSTTVAMSYIGWPWTIGDDPWNPGPETQNFNVESSWWMGGLDFTVVDIDDSGNTVTLQLNQPVMVASINSANILLDGNTGNGELDKMRGSVNKVNFSGNEYLVYGYEDQGNTSVDQMEQGWIDTMDRVLVENLSSGESNIYLIGQNISEFNNYYAASVPDWGGKLVLLNGSVTQVYPIPQWGADEPVYYTGKFSDSDLGVDLAILGLGGGPDMPEGNITSDDRYSMLMFDSLPNGINFPSQAIYDDDPDLTELSDWSENSRTTYDMYGNESGYGDSVDMEMMMGPENIQYINMSERFAWDVGTGNMESWPLAIPTLTINESAKTATAKTFAPLFDIDKTDNITIYVTAKDFSGVPINGTVELKQLKLSFGGNFSDGFFEGLPKTWDMPDSTVVNLTNGEVLLNVNSSQLPADLKSGGSYNFDFGEFTAIIEITSSGTGQKESLKTNFFIIDKANIPDDPMDGGKGPEEEHGGSGGGYL